MHGLMMHYPLLISSLIDHAEKHHGATPIVSREPDGSVHYSSWQETNFRSKQLAQALIALDVKPGDRVATLGWNTHRHLEAYYAISGLGAVCHTINPRLYKEQIAAIMNHAEDLMIFVDPSLVALVDSLDIQLPGLSVVVMAKNSGVVSGRYPTYQYEEFIQPFSGHHWQWPVFDENQASSLCYTSGTTGMPKGVLYSHRSTLLHAYAVSLPDSFGLSSRDSVLPVVPLFHANAWGMPYAAALVGAKLVLPGSLLDGENLANLLRQEEVTITAGVPTVWHGLMQYLARSETTLPSLKRLGVGGAACPEPIMRFFEELGISVLPGWGMTETSPVVTLTQLKHKQEHNTLEERLQWLGKAGRVLYGVDMKLLDEQGQLVNHDGHAVGELYVRGHWICNQYFKNDESPLLEGWFPTGDMATIDEQGFMQITDRAKDMIKSGGEWISSIVLERIAATFDGVSEAAAIAVQHDYWGERPVLLIVSKEGSCVDKEQLKQHLERHVAKWWVPDEIVLVKELPHTATGKLQKNTLREQWSDVLRGK